jgi:hypothetical protein
MKSKKKRRQRIDTMIDAQRLDAPDCSQGWRVADARNNARPSSTATASARNKVIVGAREFRMSALPRGCRRADFCVLQARLSSPSVLFFIQNL